MFVVDFLLGHPFRNCAQCPQLLSFMSGVFDEDSDVGVMLRSAAYPSRRTQLRFVLLRMTRRRVSKHRSPLLKIFRKDRVRTHRDWHSLWNLLDEMREQGFSCQREQGFCPLFRQRPKTGSETTGENKGLHRSIVALAKGTLWSILSSNG